MREYANNVIRSSASNNNEMINKCHWVSEEFFLEAKESVLQMHIASGHLRRSARGCCGDTRPWGLNMRPFRPKHKISERLILFFA